MNPAKVSACIIAYNHEKYIKECLDGALAQKVNFEYEIIISEDCATDNTREILLDYQKKYPDTIKLHLNKKNLGLIGNWTQALSLCKGEYIAICEGDDFWTSPNKLQKQVDFLDNNPDYTISTHNADVIKDDRQKIRDYCQDNHPETIDLKYLLRKGSGGPTCSQVVRNSAIKDLPDWFDKMHACDWTIQVMAARHGKMKYFKKNMSTYRKHNQGANFSSKQKAIKEGSSSFALPAKYSLEMIDNLNKYFDYKYEKELKEQSVYWYFWYIREYLNINNIKEAKKYASKIFKILFPFKLFKTTMLNFKQISKILILNLTPLFILKSIHARKK
jgi:glycosyltransferase involved in cell wall biosynthesis